MYNRSIKLTHKHLLVGSINKRRECRRYWIAESIAYSYPKVRELFTDIPEDDPLPWPKMPVLDRLSSKKYTHLGLGPILENEGTSEGTYGVVDNIFGHYKNNGEFCKGQLGFNASHFEDGSLYLINGDQKTIGLLQSIQREQVCDKTTGRAQLQWFLPVPGLFHFRMNYMEMIHEVYGGATTLVESLDHSKVHLGARRGSLSPFHHKEEVAIKAFFARITAAFQTHIDSTAFQSIDHAVDDFLSCRSIRQDQAQARKRFLQVVDQIQDDIFTYTTRLDSGTENEAIDEVFRNQIRYIQDMETYLTLKFAIKHADIGLIQDVIVRSCMLFAGGGRTNYANLCLYMLHVLVSGAATPELRHAFLSSMLVNCRGKEDSWFETDRLNEHHNLLLRLLISGRQRGSTDMKELFTKVSLTSSYTLDLREAIEQFGEHTISHHTASNATSDVQNLANTLRSSMKRKTNGRKSSFESHDIHNIGMRKLTGGVKVVEQKEPKKRKRLEEAHYTSMIDRFNKRNMAYAWVEDDPSGTSNSSTTQASQLLNYASIDVPLDTSLLQSSQIVDLEDIDR